MEKFNTRTRFQADTVRASRYQVEMDEGTQYLALGIELGGSCWQIRLRWHQSSID